MIFIFKLALHEIEFLQKRLHNIMDSKTNNEISIIKNNDSKINEIDFNNLSFGSVFTDHMLICDYKDGAWGQVVIKPYESFTFDPSAKVFHYGQAVFEGMKAYKDQSDAIWLFRPEENWIRFNHSATRLAMPEISKEIFIEGLRQLIEIEKNWVKKDSESSLYIRPFMIATGHGVSASPSTEYRFAIILSPAKSYYSGEVKVLVAEHFSRASNGGIGSAKAAGNYAGQFYPTALANQKGYQQIIWTDDATHTFLEEAGTMNVFFRIKDELYTAPTSERILDGVTRKSLIDLSAHLGIKVNVKGITIHEIVDAYKKGELLEIFGSGTAAVVNPIIGFGYKEDYFELPKIENSIAEKLKTTLTKIQRKDAEDIFGWTLKV